MTLVAVQCKYNSDEQQTYIPAVVACLLGLLGAISGEVACLTAFLAFYAFGRARLGAIGALVSGFCMLSDALNLRSNGQNIRLQLRHTFGSRRSFGQSRARCSAVIVH